MKKWFTFFGSSSVFFEKIKSIKLSSHFCDGRGRNMRKKRGKGKENENENENEKKYRTRVDLLVDRSDE